MTSKSTHSIVRMDKIFQVILKENRPMGFSEIQKITKIPETSLNRLLFTLTDLGYLKKEKRTYFLGETLRLFYPYSMNILELKEICSPFIKKLSDSIGETVKLSVLFKERVKVILFHQGANNMKITVSEGAEFPLHAGAASKVLLAFGSYSFVNCFLKTAPFKEFTKTTIVHEKSMRKELKRVRDSGIAYDNQEYIKGIFAFACPIFENNRVIAAISVPMFASKDTVREEEVQVNLKRTAYQINAHLSRLKNTV